MEIIDKLYEYQDKEYALFQSKLTPNIDKDNFIGVRVPIVRKIAKILYKNEEYEEFINKLPHTYYDENMLHGLILSEITDYEKCIEYVNIFLPYVDNWAVCDTMSPKVFKNNKDKLINDIIIWVDDSYEYTIRFGIEMLMSHYLDNDYKEEYLKIPAKIHREEYYIKMIQAWFYATALAKHWEDAIKILEEKTLDIWVHNKTIQKACESYRILPEQKEYIKTLKIKN